MERRNMMKTLASFGALALLPKISLQEKSAKKRLHFIGVGSGGTSAMMYIHNKRIVAKYTCITGPFVDHITPDVKHLFYLAPREYRDYSNTHKIALTQEMKHIFKEEEHYIVLTGLGGFSGTGLISNILKHLQDNGKKHDAICSLPYQEEGRSRVGYANKKKTELEKNKNVVIFDQNPIGGLNISKALEKGHEISYNILKDRINLV